MRDRHAQHRRADPIEQTGDRGDGHVTDRPDAVAG
jgi:hypothetical protein